MSFCSSGDSRTVLLLSMPLFGYTKLYGQVGGQAEYLRVPQAQFGPIKVPEGPSDDRFVYLSAAGPGASVRVTRGKVVSSNQR